MNTDNTDLLRKIRVIRVLKFLRLFGRFVIKNPLPQPINPQIHHKFTWTPGINCYQIK
jgi:hypothetical protein